MFDLDGTPMAGLPPAARAKLLAMADDADAARAVSASASKRMQEAARRSSDASAELARLEKPRGYVQPGANEVSRARAAKEAADAEYRRLAEREAVVREEAQVVPGCLAHLKGWLRQQGDAPLPPFAGEVNPDLRRGEDPLAAVERLRGEMAARRADLHRIASAPVTSVEARAAVRREIEALAEEGAVDVGPVLEGGRIRWPGFPIYSPDSYHRGVGNDAKSIDTRALMVWLMKGPLLARLEAELDSLADDRNALSTVQRRAETLRVRAELLALERTEETTIEAALAAGCSIPRRPDADPRAVLGLADELPGHEPD